MREGQRVRGAGTLPVGKTGVSPVRVGSHAGSLLALLAPQARGLRPIFSNRNEFHFLGHDAFFRIVKLRYRVPLRAERTAICRQFFNFSFFLLTYVTTPGTMRFRKEAIVERRNGAPLVLLHVAAIADPFCA